jgi:hypothetical protein
MAYSLGVTVKTYRSWEKGTSLPRHEYTEAKRARARRLGVTFHWWSKRRARWPGLYERRDGYRGTGWQEGPLHPKTLLGLPSNQDVTVSVLYSKDYKEAVQRKRDLENIQWEPNDC